MRNFASVVGLLFSHTATGDMCTGGGSKLFGSEWEEQRAEPPPPLQKRPFPCEWRQAVKVGEDQDGVNEMLAAGAGRGNSSGNLQASPL